jgi:type III pantothenate kinase
VFDYLGISPIVVGPGTKTGIDKKFENQRSRSGQDTHAVAALHKYGGPRRKSGLRTATT